jgi:hypothetical protein
MEMELQEIYSNLSKSRAFIADYVNLSETYS